MNQSYGNSGSVVSVNRIPDQTSHLIDDRTSFPFFVLKKIGVT
jgi:hypothetical protein